MPVYCMREENHIMLFKGVTAPIDLYFKALSYLIIICFLPFQVIIRLR